MEWYLKVVKNYVGFSGRARRKEYWMFTLFNLIFLIVLAVVDMMLGTGSAEEGVGILTLLYSLAVLLPNLAVTIRRLHDTNRSGWWIFISAIPFIGGLVLLYFMVNEGTAGPNDYGADPKAASDSDVLAAMS